GGPVSGHPRLAPFPGVPAADRRRHEQERGGGVAPPARHAAAGLGAVHRGSAPLSPGAGVAGLAVADGRFPTLREEAGVRVCFWFFLALARWCARLGNERDLGETIC